MCIFAHSPFEGIKFILVAWASGSRGNRLHSHILKLSSYSLLALPSRSRLAARSRIQKFHNLRKHWLLLGTLCVKHWNMWAFRVHFPFKGREERRHGLFFWPTIADNFQRHFHPWEHVHTHSHTHMYKCTYTSTHSTNTHTHIHTNNLGCWCWVTRCKVLKINAKWLGKNKI